MIFLLQVAAALPLLPISFPLCWLLLNAYGTARVMAAFKLSKQAQKYVDSFDELCESAVIATPTKLQWSDVRPYFWNLLLGREYTLYRTANLLHAFGSVTALCCVDKKGILSWPNPTAEKVFFLKSYNSRGINSKDSLLSDSQTSLVMDDPKEPNGKDFEHLRDCSIDGTILGNIAATFPQKPIGLSNFIASGYTHESCVEVLDLTHDNNIPFRVQFDDPHWKRHINSLKPLGLAILLNTCNSDTQDWYTQFSSHIACESLHNDVVVPVVNRRCLCELAKQIGFQDQALNVYQLQQQLSTFRHVQPEQVKRDKFVKSLSFSKLKFPFPNMVSVVIKELNTGMLQLMSQGTGDIVLDSCSDFWDGRDLCPLSESDRKKILDFYHRTSLTSYCTVFAYRPLSTAICNDLGRVYLEIPAECNQLYSHLWSPSSPRTWDLPPLDDRMKVMNRCLSSDSLLGHSIIESEPVNTAESCFETQCNQVFIGMVAMQYQATADMVHLIEQLDKACIRFVHFSKENELRSRVFSEKMGLESGWNCHVSLLSEGKSPIRHQPSTEEAISPTCECPRSPKVWSTLEAMRMRQLSISAPSAINLEVSTVKFEEEISLHNLTATENSSALTGIEHNTVIEKKMVASCSKNNVNEIESTIADVTDALMGDNESHYEYRHASRSPSHITESTDQSAPIAFDMSNRAKLPKGIENIRPHLENIDNVPLLVSLFTDSTPDATAEMIQIMQEYGEVVCCLGSSASSHNMGIFIQSDVSISVEPLYPQLCLHHPVYDPTPPDVPAPIELSRHLNSLACSLSYCREEPSGLYHLIMEARSFALALRHIGHYLLASALALTLCQMLASVLLLPPIISIAHLIVLIGVIIPVLAVSLLAVPVEAQVMALATGKNDHVVDSTLVFNFVTHNGLKFIPSVIIVILCFILTLSSFCNEIDYEHAGHCNPLLGNRNYSKLYEWNGWGSEYVYSLYTAQNVAAFQLVLYFTCISASFVHRLYQLWTRSPFTNKAWCCAVAIVLILQVIYFSFDMYLRSHQVPRSTPGFANIPTEVWIICWLWPLCALAINEMVKKQEIKVHVRFQKRARLEFGTKLGMNSPF